MNTSTCTQQPNYNNFAFNETAVTSKPIGYYYMFTGDNDHTAAITI